MRIANRDCGTLVARREPFTGSNLRDGAGCPVFSHHIAPVVLRDTRDLAHRRLVKRRDAPFIRGVPFFVPASDSRTPRTVQNRRAGPRGT